MNYTVYKITNLINRKYYIGSHITKNLKDDYMGSGKILIRAINKSGLKNFKKEILYIFDNEKQMFAKEKELINVDNPLCYNIHEGGKGGWKSINKNGLNRSKKQIENSAKALSDKWKNDKEYSAKMKKISSITIKNTNKSGLLNNLGGFKGHEHTEESKLKMSKSSKGIISWNKGKHHSKETKLKISNSLKLKYENH